VHIIASYLGETPDYEKNPAKTNVNFPIAPAPVVVVVISNDGKPVVGPVDPLVVAAGVKAAGVPVSGPPKVVTV
jgi:hypothetical protein